MKKKVASISIGKTITCVVVFLILIGISNDMCMGKGRFLTFYELVLSELNETYSLLFGLSFIILLIFASNEKPKNLLSTKAAWAYLKQAVCSALLVIVLLLSASLVYSLIGRGVEGAFVNEWSYNSGFSMTGRGPSICLLIAVLLFSLRCVFLFVFISLINVLTRKPYWGIWAVLFICFVDFRFYNQTHITYPLNILPVEHTRILYTRAFNLPMETVVRGSYMISVLYWIILILIICEIIEFVYKKRGQQQ